MIPLLVTTALASPVGPPLDPATVPPSATGHGPQNDGKEHPVVARLLVDQEELAPGGRARLGIHLKQADGWHTYWKTPGDIGLPTEVTWTLPAGWTPGEQHQPVPERFDQDGQVSYGYEGSVLHVTELVVPADAKPGTITVAADVRWLVCKTSCIPGSTHVELPVRVGAAGKPSTHAPLFDAWAARWPAAPAAVPELVVTPMLSVSAVRSDASFQAAVIVGRADGRPLDGVDLSRPWPLFTPIAVGSDWSIDSTHLARLPDGRVAAVVKATSYDTDPLPTDDAFGGLVQVKLGDRTVAVELTQPLPRVAKDAPVTENADPVFTASAPPAGNPPGDGGPPATAQSPVPAAAVPFGAPVAPQAGLLANLLLAFVGGLILNIMPCVLPVLTLKVYGLVEEAEQGAHARRAAGLAYTAGVLASFWALAGSVVGLRAVLGMEVDWGFQFQYPPYVAALATLVFAFGLSLLGVFEIPVFGAQTAGEQASREGPVGVFFSGVFATLLATPCSAPFLGSAIAYAFGAPTPTLFLIFTAIGLGLAAPFLGVAFAPSLSRFLPKPGAWMDIFKQLMGLTLLATTIWLFDVLLSEIGSERATGFLVFLLAVGTGAWIYGRFGGLAESRGRQAGAALVGFAVAALIGWRFLDLRFAEAEAACAPEAPVGELTYGEHVPWAPFSEEAVAGLAGRLVFVDFTADWCLTCKVNEKTVLETATVRDAMASRKVVPLKADWTRRDEVITRWLHDNGRAGVPMYLILPADRSRAPILLPEVITPSMVVDALAAADAPATP